MLCWAETVDERVGEQNVAFGSKSRLNCASAVIATVVMKVNLRKLLVTASCWLVILCGLLDRVEGADHAATVDGILRSVVAVRSQLEPVLKYRLAQRTTALPQVTRTGGLSCGGTIRASGLQRLFNCVNSDNRPSEAPPAATQINVQERVDDTSQYTPVEIVRADIKGSWSTYSDGTSLTVQNEKNRPNQREPVRSNPLGFIFPTLEQINHFNQWQRPYQSPNQLPAATIPTRTTIATTSTTPSTTTSTTTVRPKGNDFYFPHNGNDRFTPFSTVRPAQYYTTSVTTNGQQHLETSTPSIWEELDITKKFPEEETTTEPAEEESGLGNRIDNKLLLSLVG
ncbi:uncharacterized protein LOC125763686 [Anopheles funestus]|uniref:uncharacterized protein LOC125763686 n=1 Tax=Anopheles funestus TaxID=62324 RepID=UPI0020C70E7B|nr:uncharacterized protein LOC125763686 [Anopheles funestus]